MKIHKRFQIDKSEGSIEVQVDFALEDGVVKISNINIQANFESGLPNSPSLEQFNNTAFLVIDYLNIAGKRIMERLVGNKYADEIVEKILNLRDQIRSSHIDIEKKS